MPHIILLGTLDTKLEEFQYLYDQILAFPQSTSSPIKITLIDCGRSSASDHRITLTQADLTTRYGSGKSITDLPRGEIIKHMTSLTSRCVTDLLATSPVHGIISAGGSGGTTLAAAVMRDVAPIGMPKLLVSTVASGDTGPLVGETDITMMYSVVDVAGTNQLLRNILGNAAAAIVGMAVNYEANLGKAEQGKKTRVGVTMFGVTTPGVDRIRQYLESRYDVEVFVFHATGHGGRAMERLVREGRLDAVIDLTTTEICDHLFGGNMSAGGERLEAALEAGVPNVISLGATDMVNFGPRSSVPAKYEGRNLYEHNPTVTLMRTTAEDCEKVARFMAEKIKKNAKDPLKVQVWVPKGGVSMISVPDGPYADKEADEALLRVLRCELEGTGVKLVEDQRDINDAGFAEDVAEALTAMLEGVL
ncbi:hypothetical protein K461DRAFT_219952 [Myriangium duriaei CBS 260.36]|uniref:Uncharacterized protein n=1 Tax=Myriangium duriaei CBS 260.36 TaxID=1168546 RepID=A0A9P4J8I3_9PEZI|nr:hypothetical protein K461DRAFT_219952 [Myriangium duriaei CBS 260.36]